MHSEPELMNAGRPLDGDRLIRIAAAATVIAVDGIAAVISYTHIRDLAAAHGAPGLAPQLLPFSVDGLILAASLVMLQEARARRPAPALAWVALVLGISATLAANVAYGARYGVAGGIIWSWPALAFIIGTELPMIMIRRARAAADLSLPGVPAVPDVSGSDIPVGPGPAAANGRAYPEARTVFAAELARGEVPPIARIRSELHCGQAKAQRVRAYLTPLARTR